jgi:diguanylate cyclase (GGDEF)-like protein
MGRLLEKFKFRSIQTTFIAPFIMAIFVSIIVLTGILLTGAQNVSQETLNVLSSQIMEQVREELKLRFGEALKVNAVHAGAYQQGILDFSDAPFREQYFSGSIAPYSDVAMAYVGFPDGSFYGARRTVDGSVQVVRNDVTTGGTSVYYSIDATGKAVSIVEKYNNFDPRVRPWYQLAELTGGPAFTDIYNHFVFNQPTITVSYPVYEQDQLVAVFGVDYLLTWIGEKLSNLPVDENGLVYLVDESGNMVASSKKSEAVFLLTDGVATQLSAPESPNPLVAESVNIESRQDLAEIPWVEIGGERYYVEESLFDWQGLTWKIYVLLNESDFMSPMYQAVNRSLISLVVSMLALFLLVLLISRHLTRPILRLNQAAGELADGNFVYVPDEMRHDELGELSRSFNSMAIDLTNAVAGLERKVEMRTAELKESNERLNRLSFLDGLTGLPNRRRFDAFYSEVYQTNYINKHALGVLIIDIDDFKKYNDAYGHLAGDDCLKKVAFSFGTVLTQSKDLAARYGGEEFAVILQGRSSDEVVSTAEQLREAVRDLNMVHEESPYGRVTVSIGAAYFVPDVLGSREFWLHQADLALYTAKSEGKDQVKLSKESQKDQKK